jgi:transcriptional regulator with XRE-family HTH domain
LNDFECKHNGSFSTLPNKVESSLNLKTYIVAKLTNPLMITLQKKLKELKMSSKHLHEATLIPRDRIDKWLQGKSNPKAADTKKLEEWMEKVPSSIGKRKLVSKDELINVIVTDNSKVIEQNGQIILQNGKIVDMNAKITEMNFKLAEYLKPSAGNNLGNSGQPSA